MEKLIDAEGLAIDLIHSMDYCDDILEIVERQPEAIVRCKDCKYADIFHNCDRVSWWGSADDYCSRGQRKEADDETR